MDDTKLEDVLMGALVDGRDRGPAEAGARESSRRAGNPTTAELPEIQCVIADLGSDWAFTIQLNADGTLGHQWFGGAAATQNCDIRTATMLEEDQSAAAEHFLCALRMGSDRSEYRLKFADGGVRWIESALCSVR